MYSLKLIAAGLAIASSAGCVATIPTITATGKHNIIFVNETPVIAFEYPSNEACADSVNKILKHDVNTRRAVASGDARIVCSSLDVVYNLTYESTVTSIMTGQVFPTKTHSKGSCILFAKSYKDQYFKFSCLDS